MVHSLQYTMYNVPCTANREHCTVHRKHITARIAQFAVYNVKCIVNSLRQYSTTVYCALWIKPRRLWGEHSGDVFVRRVRYQQFCVLITDPGCIEHQANTNACHKRLCDFLQIPDIEFRFVVVSVPLAEARLVQAEKRPDRSTNTILDRLDGQHFQCEGNASRPPLAPTSLGMVPV